jgi:Cellulase (glycosyl hydrolase family 5)
LRGLICLAALALLLGSEAWPPAKTATPLVGFSYSPVESLGADRVPTQDLAMLLDATDPDLVRLPIYWESVEPTPDSLDFSSVDELLAVVEEHDQVASRQTRVVLTIGARNFLYPELHEPVWAGPRAQPHLNDVQSGAAYRAYFDGSLMRYRSSPLLYAWQVENEPFDYVVNASTGADQITVEQLSWEISQVHQLDPGRTVVTTTFDGWNSTIDMLQLYAPPLVAALHAYPSGHPGETLAAGDALGLDVYSDAPSTPLRFTSPDLRSVLKQQALDFWAGQAKAQGKQLWLAEMQAQPWTEPSAFTPANLVASAVDYRQEPLKVVLLWGAETWLKDPAWMAGAQQAMAIMRS